MDIVTTRVVFFFFFNDTATTEIYTLSLHDALPICQRIGRGVRETDRLGEVSRPHHRQHGSENLLLRQPVRSEEHTSELQSRLHLVCRLLLEKKKNRHMPPILSMSNVSYPHAMRARA